MIVVRDSLVNSHETVAIYDNSGREIAEVRANQGRLLFKNWSEISGIPPLNFTSRADYLQDYRIYGNTVQDGTPTPENPVEVQGCGERTENGFVVPVTVGGVNLFDYNWLWTKENTKINNYFNYITIAMKPNTEYTISNNYRVNNITPSRRETALIVVNSETEFTTIGGGVDRFRTVTTASDGLLRIAYRIAEEYQDYQDIVVNRETLADGTYYIQINEGSSASPYEPYHEPITTPVYVGSEPLHKIGDYADYVDFERAVVVRRIKKLVLTGEESYIVANLKSYRIPISITLINSIISRNVFLVRASHYITNDSSESSAKFKDVYTIRRGESNNFTWFFTPKSFFSGEISRENCVMQFKAYLAAQYAAGTPVTVWYVLANPEEEPLENLFPIQTIKGSDILTADTTVQPSEMYLKGKIKQIT